MVTAVLGARPDTLRLIVDRSGKVELSAQPNSSAVVLYNLNMEDYYGIIRVCTLALEALEQA